MFQKFALRMRELLPKPNQKLLVAVSGGIDSMVLCNLLDKHNYLFDIAHCNFKLREKESDADEVFVLDWAKKNNRKAHHTQFDTENYARQNKLSIQMGARELRYHWFDQLRSQFGYNYILTAHHCDDQIETFLINFTRGTGIHGLVGIPEKNEKYLRPLLQFSRHQIETYALKHKVEWREDSSNASRKYLRNKLRHEVVPVLKEENPELHQSFLSTLKHLQQTEALVQHYALQLKEEIMQDRGSYISLDISALKKHPLTEAVLYQLLSAYKFTEWNNVYHLLDAEKGKQVQSPTHVLEKDKHQLCLFTKTKNEEEQFTSIRLENSKEVVTFDGRILHLNKLDKARKFEASTGNLDADLVPFPLELRRVKPTDKFKPLGMKNHKKIHKFLKDEGIPTSLKKETWVVAHQNTVLWVVNQRINDDFKITSNTKQCLELSTSLLPIS